MNKEELKREVKLHSHLQHDTMWKPAAIDVPVVIELINQLGEQKIPLNEKETLKERVWDLAYKQGIYGVDIQPCIEGEDVDKLIDLIDQLDEHVEELSQEWIDEHLCHEDEYDFTYIDPDDLQNLLIDEPEKPVIPSFIADYIERAKPRHDSLYQAMGERAGEEVNEWIQAMYNSDKFARAWLDGYTVERENLYYIKKDAGTNYLYFTSIDVYGDGKINYNSESDKFHALKLPKEKAEALAIIADGEIEEVTE